MRLFLWLALSIGIGVSLFVIWSTYSNVKYDTVGSLDIVSGAIIEFFLLTLLLEIFQNKQAKKWKKDLEEHLKEIEKILRKGDKNEH